MSYEFDPDKRERKLSEHGVDLLYAARIFEGPTLEKSMIGGTIVKYGGSRLVWSMVFRLRSFTP